MVNKNTTFTNLHQIYRYIILAQKYLTASHNVSKLLSDNTNNLKHEIQQHSYANLKTKK